MSASENSAVKINPVMLRARIFRKLLFTPFTNNSVIRREYKLLIGGNNFY